MAFWKYTGSTAQAYPQRGIVAQPGAVYDFGSAGAPQENFLGAQAVKPTTSNWVSDPGPATASPLFDSIQPLLSTSYALAPAPVLPAGITGARGVFTSPSLYNYKPSQLQKTRAKLGAAQAGTGFCQIDVIGDSIAGGTGNGSSADLASFPAVLRSMLISRGILSGGEGWVPSHSNVGVGIDARWATTGFTYYNGADISTQFWSYSNANGNTITYTSTQTGTVLEFIYSSSSTAFNYVLDGGSSTPVTPPGGSSFTKVTLSGLANTTHTIVFTASASGCGIAACRVRAATSGLLVSNFGVGGSQAQPWNNSSAFWYQNGPVRRGFAAPDLTIVEYTLVNETLDRGLGIPTPSTSLTNLTQIVNAEKALSSAPDILLVLPPKSNTSQISLATWQSYQQNAYSLADSLNLPLLDMSDRWTDYTTANTNGQMYDNYHPNGAGYADLARAILPLLVAS